MCGRFENRIKNAELNEVFARYIGSLQIDYDLEEELYMENIAPTDKVKIIKFDKKDNVFKLQTIKWRIKTKVFDPTRQEKGK